MSDEPILLSREQWTEFCQRAHAAKAKLAEANKGAQRNAHINQSLVKQLEAAEAKVAELERPVRQHFYRSENKMDALKTLLARCKCGVYLTVNEHRDYYDTPEERLDELAARECPPTISDEVRAGILRTGNIVELQFYPDAPVGFDVIVHHDLDEALRLALNCLKQ